jgi:hypothetical protein
MRQATGGRRTTSEAMSRSLGPPHALDWRGRRGGLKAFRPGKSRRATLWNAESFTSREPQGAARVWRMISPPNPPCKQLILPSFRLCLSCPIFSPSQTPRSTWSLQISAVCNALIMMRNWFLYFRTTLNLCVVRFELRDIAPKGLFSSFAPPVLKMPAFRPPSP